VEKIQIKSLIKTIIIPTMIILSNCSESFVNNSAYNVKKAEKLTIDIDSLGISDLPFPHGSIIDFDKTVTVGNGDEWIGKIVLVNKNNTSDLFDFYRNEMPKYKYLNKSNKINNKNSLIFQNKKKTIFIKFPNANNKINYIEITSTPIK